MDDYVIEMRHITKEFPGIIANDDITLQLKRGEIHALLGENGAGKSTLMSVLFGMYQPEKGEIYKDGKLVKIHSPNDANALGIGMVHQHFKLVECFTVLDNIVLGAEDSRFGYVSKKKARVKIESLMEKYGLHVDLDKKIYDVSVGSQQRTEILKMLYRDNEILIFDEPTAVLTPQEIHELMKTMKNLASEGKSILFISHKLNEIKEVSDRCTVLRKGKYVGTVDTKDVTTEDLAEMMVGRNVSFSVDKKPAEPKGEVLQVEHLNVEDKRTKKFSVHDVSIDVKSGEIVGIAGIDGNGQTELVRAITGLGPITSGTILLNGNDITKVNIRKRIDEGMSHIPEDRHKDGLVLPFTLEEDFILQKSHDEEFSKKGFIRFKERKAYADELIDEYDVRSSNGAETVTQSMSGGNQQKAIVARELDREHSLLVAVQPTRGLDVGAIEGIHKRIVKDRDVGKGVLLVSLELDEIMNLSDRLYVMYEGEIVAEFKSVKDVSVQELGLYMAGAKRQEQYQKTEEEKAHE